MFWPFHYIVEHADKQTDIMSQPATTCQSCCFKRRNISEQSGLHYFKSCLKCLFGYLSLGLRPYLIYQAEKGCKPSRNLRHSMLFLPNRRRLLCVLWGELPGSGGESQVYGAFKCSSDCLISISGKWLLRLVGMWEQHGCKKVVVLYSVAQSV